MKIQPIPTTSHHLEIVEFSGRFSHDIISILGTISGDLHEAGDW